jgi:tetratricopeptide (TPR) repeat protein
MVFAQANISKKVKKASGKIASGIEKNNPDTLAGGYFDLGESYYQNGELQKAEIYYQKAKTIYEKAGDAAGIAKSSRALAKAQEDLKKNKEALGNYNTSRDNSQKVGDIGLNTLNGNDISRLSKPDSVLLQERLIQSNIDLGIKKGDTGEIVTNFSRMGELNLKNNKTSDALDAFNQAYQFSKNNSAQAMKLNTIITDVYLQNKNFSKAIETKKDFLGQGYVQNSSQLKAKEITSLADIYIQKKEDTTAIQLLNESYDLSVRNGHTLEARSSIERLDSIFQSKGRRDLSLQLYKDFLQQLPAIIARDSSIADNRIVAETETRIRQLETEKSLKDDLIRRKNNFNYWLIAFIGILVVFIVVILNMVKKLRLRNKKIALQSLRREMNPHFIFNSLNSINQFIANNNELEANRYLTKFSTLMRRVMENSKEDFVLFSHEIDLLRNYLELEKSRFDDKFDFSIEIDDPLFTDERLYIPTMLVQPHLENAIWHGLRYVADKGFLKLSFSKTGAGVEIVIEDNGIGIVVSKNVKTANQKKHSGRGITNTMERISILNEVYHQNIICQVEDKAAPDRGVRVKIIVPVLKDFKA